MIWRRPSTTFSGSDVEPNAKEDGTMEYYVKHRTAQETSGSGYRPPDMPWKYAGPFTHAEAVAYWDRIHPNWQEGGVVGKCHHCGQYVPTPSDS
jgi:hypothetical protein